MQRSLPAVVLGRRVRAMVKEQEREVNHSRFQRHMQQTLDGDKN